MHGARGEKCVEERSTLKVVATHRVRNRVHEEEASEDVDSNLRNTDIPNEVTAEESAEGVQKLRCGDEGARP